MKYLNLGCGSRFHPSWTNVNFTPSGKDVIAHDLNQGIPFADNSFDVVYHSHVLEHFPKNQAVNFLKECYRVLRPEGILRVVVPDLEQIVKAYLCALEKARIGEQEWKANYDWIMLEMYDQVVRNTSGGEMFKYLSNPQLSNVDFVIQRCGVEVKKIIDDSRQNSSLSTVNSAPNLLKKIYRFFRYPNYRQESLLKLILGKEYEYLQMGRFKNCGEVHQWMYDSYSLSLLLKQCSFTQVIQRNATESYISDWNSYNLDTEPDGTIYKPDSLYMEGVKTN
jgi:predicted SAM-dependent methyltransferase